MRCPYYGYHGIELQEVLVAESGSNECGLGIAGKRCRLERDGLEPVLANCQMNDTHQARKFDHFVRIELPRPVTDYPAAYPD